MLLDLRLWPGRHASGSLLLAGQRDASGITAFDRLARGPAGTFTQTVFSRRAFDAIMKKTILRYHTPQ